MATAAPAPKKPEPPKIVELSPEDAKKPRWSDAFRSQPLEKLQQQAIEISKKYNNSIVPIIVDRAKDSQLDISRHQYLVPADKTLGFLFAIVRKHWTAADASKAMHFMVATEAGQVVQANPGALIAEVQRQYRWTSGFVFVTFHEESTFG